MSVQHFHLNSKFLQTSSLMPGTDERFLTRRNVDLSIQNILMKNIAYPPDKLQNILTVKYSLLRIRSKGKHRRYIGKSSFLGFMSTSGSFVICILFATIPPKLF